MKPKKKKNKIGSITRRREYWEINPTTKIHSSKKNKEKNNRKAVKDKLKKGDYDF